MYFGSSFLHICIYIQLFDKEVTSYEVHDIFVESNV